MLPASWSAGCAQETATETVSGPYLTIDLDKIEQNARAVVSLCAEHGIAVTGVTKGVSGCPEIATVMLRGGVISIGDSRMENIHRLARAGVTAAPMLLRVPALSAAEDVVKSVGVSLNSELTVLSALSRAAGRAGLTHDVIVMVDLGDLREGIWPDALIDFVGDAVQLSNIRLRGIGTNLACFSGVVPTEDNMKLLISLAEEIEQTFGIALDWISGLNSSALELIASGHMPKRINHARIGEAILLGRETIHREPWPGTSQDAFTLSAEILEWKIKPSVPIGTRGEDAFGKYPVFEDKGERTRALLNIGREDVDIAGLVPLDPGLTILGASSGYLVIDAGDIADEKQVGDEIAFSVNYGALLAAMTSEYVEKRFLTKGTFLEETRQKRPKDSCRTTRNT
jgi:predicted amino acid racemase